MPGRLVALFLLAPVLLGFASTGCTRVEQARRCRELAATVNPRLGEIENLAEEPQKATNLRAIAERYDGIADDLGPLEFHSQSLALAVKDYGSHMRAIAVESRKAADALEANDKGDHGSALRAIRSRSAQLKSTQRLIENACR